MKKLFSIALCICLTLAAVFTAVPSFATKANADTEAAQALIRSYVNGGNYIKDTEIYTLLTGDTHFHAGADSTTRRTVYSKNGTQLYMTTGSDVEGAGYRDVTVDEEKKVERFYTDAEGEHRSYLVNKESIKDWFTDLQEMSELGTWNANQDGSYEQVFGDDDELATKWRDFVAPMWISKTEVFTKVVAYESAGSLVLDLCNSTTVFAKATIKKPVSKTYTFGNYTAGTQYADNEVHELDNNVTCTTTQAHFTSELRLYSSDAHNAYAIFQSANSIIDIAVNAGNKVDTLNVYGSNDGTNWYLTGTIEVTSTSYEDYALTLGASYKWIKLDVAGDQQVRLKSIALTTVPAPACKHANTETTTVDATCAVPGSTTVTCTDCGETISTVEIPATGEHTYENGACTSCGTADPDASVETEVRAVATFEFGANSSATHVDGNDLGATKTYTDGDYTLSLTSMSKVYGPAYDATGNSCIKLGTGSAASKFTFTVPAEITKVVIKVAGYKTSSAKVSINNGTTQTISTLSNNGAYTDIEIDTTTNKTISFATVSGGYRAMINSIEFHAVVEVCEHANTSEERQEATCGQAGFVKVTCDDCKAIISEVEIPATGEHNYENGACTVCDAKDPNFVNPEEPTTQTWEIATSIAVGDTIVIACASKSMELNGISTTSTKYGLGTAYTSAPAGVYKLTVEAGSTDGTFAFKTEDGKYLTWTSGNSLNVSDTKSANTSWKVTFSGETATIANAADNSRKLQWNASSPRFACYTGSQTAICLYKLEG